MFINRAERSHKENVKKGAIKSRKDRIRNHELLLLSCNSQDPSITDNTHNKRTHSITKNVLPRILNWLQLELIFGRYNEMHLTSLWMSFAKYYQTVLLLSLA